MPCIVASSLKLFWLVVSSPALGVPWLSVTPAAACEGIPGGCAQELLPLLQSLCPRAASLLQSLVMLFEHLQASAADTGAAAGAAELQAAEAVILQDLDMMLKHDAALGSVSFSS